jgi:hypothetical protein
MYLILKDNTRLEMDSEVALGDITLMECSEEELLTITPKLTAENCATYKIEDDGQVIRLKNEQKMNYTVTPVKHSGGYKYSIHIIFEDIDIMEKILARLDLTDEQITEIQEALTEIA